MSGSRGAVYRGDQTDFTKDLKKITVPILVMHSDDDQLTAALLRGDWSVIYGLPPDIQTLVLAQIGPIFVAGMQTTFLVTAAGNFVCVFAALLFMPRTAAA